MIKFPLTNHSSILLYFEKDASIRLCDIGNAVFDNQQCKDKCISTSHYRAPEAILGLINI